MDDSDFYSSWPDVMVHTERKWWGTNRAEAMKKTTETFRIYWNYKSANSLCVCTHAQTHTNRIYVILLQMPKTHQSIQTEIKVLCLKLKSHTLKAMFVYCLCYVHSLEWFILSYLNTFSLSCPKSYWFKRAVCFLFDQFHYIFHFITQLQN